MHDDSYIRGGGSVQIDPRRLGRGLAVAAVAVLAACTVVLAVVAATGHSGADALRRHGVPVQVSVTSCTGITSGIGMGAEYYQCQGRYELGGRTYESTIHGVRSQEPEGAVLSGVAVPGQPSTLSLRAGAQSSSLSRYVPAIVLGALTVVGAIGLAIWGSRRRLG